MTRALLLALVLCFLLPARIEASESRLQSANLSEAQQIDQAIRQASQVSQSVSKALEGHAVSCQDSCAGPGSPGALIQGQVEGLALRLKALFAVPYRIVWSGSADCNVQSEWIEGPSGGAWVMTFCTREVCAWNRTYSWSQIAEIEAYTLFHEFSHYLLEADVPRGMELRMAAYDELERRTGHTINEIAERIGVLEHENVDAFAVKLSKEFGYGVDAVVDQFRRYEALNPQMTSDEKRLLQRDRPGRIRAVLASYQEGWNAWSNFHRVGPLCDRGLVHQFAKARGYLAILDRIGSTPCANPPLAIVVQDLDFSQAPK